MANFKPLKKYLISLIDEMVIENNAKPPFLDIGCGIGDIALHFAKIGWSGKAIDVSHIAITQAKKNLQSYPNIEIVQQNIFETTGKYNTIIACDIIEHLEDDQSFIKKITELLNNNGTLIMSFPILMSEWRWDDNFYGHVRRYEIPQIIELLCNNGFKTTLIWDFTFPIFWLIRRIYTKIIPGKLIMPNPAQNTLASASRSAWDYGILTTLFEKIIWWKPVFWMQKKFRNHLVECECVIIAKLSNNQNAK